jgi:hypothetical protein
MDFDDMTHKQGYRIIFGKRTSSGPNLTLKMRALMKAKHKMTMLACLCAGLWAVGGSELSAANPPPLLNEPVDISGDFHNFANLYYLADKFADFDPATDKGQITYQRSAHVTHLAFNNMLPPGTWDDYQTGKASEGGWQHISLRGVTPQGGPGGGTDATPRGEAGPIPIVMLVRDGTVIPKIALAQSTLQMDWSKLTLEVFAKNAQTATGLICLPSDNVLHELTLKQEGHTFKLVNDPLAGKVIWKIKMENGK